MKRAKRRGLLRNVAVALGNWGSPEAVLVLIRRLGDEEPLIRRHPAWRLGRMRTQEALEALHGREDVAENGRVREEFALALPG